METTKIPSVKTERIDPSIENALPENCNMSILFQEDGLVFSILRNDLKKFIVLGEYELKSNAQDLESLFYFREQLQGDFASVSLAFATPRFTIIPAALFDMHTIEKYANFQFNVLQEEVLYSELKTHGLVVVFSMPNRVKEHVKMLFQDVEIMHAGAFTISHYLNQYKNKPGDHIHVQLWRGTAEVVVISNARLQLYNTFQYQSEEDLLYFILNVYEQLGLNPETLPLKISGEIEKGQKAWNQLLTYIRFVELEERMPNYSYSHEFKALPNQQYNRIFQFATCV